MAPVRRRNACGKTFSGERKLLAGEEVEVLSNDDGLLGSWHRGVVLECGDGSRLVEYTDLLRDDQSSKLVECIKVVPAIDGDLFSPSKFHRGWIRPWLAPQPLQPGEVCYGQCVDAFVDGCHWEGVVIDHLEGSMKRRVLFPDQGDESDIDVNQLRRSRDWNEVTGQWKCRGNWLFLIVLQKYEEQVALPVSIRQIWYDLRSRPFFEHDINIWIHGSRSKWDKAVADTIQELWSLCNDKLALEAGPIECPQESGSDAIGKNLAPPLVTDQDASDDIVGTLPMPTLEFVAKEGQGNGPHILSEEHLKAAGWMVAHNECGQKYFISPEGQRHSSFALASKACVSASRQNDAGEKCVPRKISTLPQQGDELVCHSSTDWKPCSLSPELLKDEVLATFKQGKTINIVRKLMLRKHLLALGWKIETRDVRFRYISPQGRTYYSLNIIRVILLDKQQGICSHNSDMGEQGVVKEKKRPACEIRSVSTTGKRKLPFYANLYPENLPDSIREYVEAMAENPHSKAMESREELQLLRSNARKHLMYSGWSCSMYTRNGKQEMWYTRPGNQSKSRSFNSLLTACKSFLTEENRCSDSPKSTEQNVELGWNISKPKGTISSKRKHNSLVSILTPGDDTTLLSPRSIECKKAKKRKKAGHDSENTLLRPGSEQDVHLLSICQRRVKTVLSFLIDKDIVVPRDKLFYKSKMDGGSVKTGCITGDGIKCLCCNEIFSISNFEVHAGRRSQNPYANLYLKDGRSLSQCLAELMGASRPKGVLQARIKGDNSCFESDFICSACQDGGHLLLCDQCPSSYHPSCVGLEVIPAGSWSCPCCRCFLCQQGKYDPNIFHFTEKTIMYCDQCERQYHVGCINKNTDQQVQLDHRPEGSWFCSRKCSEIHLHLQNLVGKSFPTSVKGLTWTILSFHKDYSRDDNIGVEKMAEYYAKLRLALDILHECFVTVIEARTQSDLVADVLFNQESELHRLNFRGFYTLLLERDDEIISVANFRVYGDRLAEMPLVGTRVAYRRQGMCRTLLGELEKLLSSLGVERLALPAVPQLLETWTKSFGFTVMTDADKLEVADHAILCFQGTYMCHKFLKEPAKLLRDPQASQLYLLDSRMKYISTSTPDMAKPIEVHSEIPGQLCPLERSSSRSDMTVACCMEDMAYNTIDTAKPDSWCSIRGQNHQLENRHSTADAQITLGTVHDADTQAGQCSTFPSSQNSARNACEEEISVEGFLRDDFVYGCDASIVNTPCSVSSRCRDKKGNMLYSGEVRGQPTINERSHFEKQSDVPLVAPEEQNLIEQYKDMEIDPSAETSPIDSVSVPPFGTCEDKKEREIHSASAGMLDGLCSSTKTCLPIQARPATDPSYRFTGKCYERIKRGTAAKVLV